MRPIKFRAWDKAEKRMFYPSSISWKGDAVWLCDAQGGGKNVYESVREHAELMQFTGLYDKNGKEIWEGDVVGSQGSDPGLISWYFNRFVISTAKGLAEIRKIDLNLLEVLGNIYENPELLK